MPIILYDVFNMFKLYEGYITNTQNKMLMKKKEKNKKLPPVSGLTCRDFTNNLRFFTSKFVNVYALRFHHRPILQSETYLSSQCIHCIQYEPSSAMDQILHQRAYSAPWSS